MNTDHSVIWETYASAWKAATREEKLILLNDSLVPECIYRDPLTVANGFNDLLNYMSEFHTMIPGGHFVTQDFKSHNNRCIAQWNMCAGDGSVVGEGISYGEYSETGKLLSMTGFFDLPKES